MLVVYIANGQMMLTEDISIYYEYKCKKRTNTEWTYYIMTNQCVIEHYKNINGRTKSCRLTDGDHIRKLN